MLPSMNMGCTGLAAPAEVMHHIVEVESSFNPYAIGVVGGHLVRQPRSLGEALATVRLLERRGFNFSLGLAQVNRHNLERYGLDSYEAAFQACPNLRAGSRILAECYRRSGNDWGKSFSCYYSGNFVTGYRRGYVQRIFASMRIQGDPIEVIAEPSRRPLSAGRLAGLEDKPARAQPTLPRLASPPEARFAVERALPHADDAPKSVVAILKPPAQAAAMDSPAQVPAEGRDAHPADAAFVF